MVGESKRKKGRGRDREGKVKEVVPPPSHRTGKEGDIGRDRGREGRRTTEEGKEGSHERKEGKEGSHGRKEGKEGRCRVCVCCCT
jgi:hypothetical protein